jgi:hypothetical protein
VTVVTNEPTVTLTVNGTLIGTLPAVDHKAVFENVPLQQGENILVAATDHARDAISLNGVDVHNDAYDLPDIMAAVNAGNWFNEQTVEGEPVDHYTIDSPGGDVLANEECLRIIRGWLMASDSMPFTSKMTVVSRLPNYQAMWGDRAITQIPVVGKYMTKEDLEHLDRMLRRVPKPE